MPCDRAGQALALLAALVLVVVFVTGGSSSETGFGVLVAQWLSLPLLLTALYLAWQRRRLQAAPLACVAVAAIVALPALQLLPLTESLWRLAPARQDLLQDLYLAGVSAVDFRWSLAPLATERNLYLLLPGVALFFTALVVDASLRRMLLWLLVGLALFSLLLGFVQIGAPQDSFVNPFPELAPMLGGVFANRNHQAITLAMGLVVVLAFWLAPRSGAAAQLRRGARVGVSAGLVLVFLAALPLVGSRAGLIIALLVSGLLVVWAGLHAADREAERHWPRVLVVLALAMAGAGIWSAMTWMDVETGIAGSRWAMMQATVRLGLANLPFGSGFGGYVLMFEQATGGALMQRGFVNNAHNDYAQWWFEGGLAALAVLPLALVALVRSLRDLLRRPAGSRGRQAGLAAFCALFALLLHSSVDYPLRTPALMTVFALLAGILVAGGIRTDQTRGD